MDCCVDAIYNDRFYIGLFIGTCIGIYLIVYREIDHIKSGKHQDKKTTVFVFASLIIIAFTSLACGYLFEYVNLSLLCSIVGVGFGLAKVREYCVCKYSPPTTTFVNDNRKDE